MRTFQLAALVILASVISACAGPGATTRPDSNGQALLVIPGSLELKSIDGVAQSQPLLRPDPSYQPLSPGLHTLEFAYTEFWGSSQAGELVRSDIHRIDLQVSADVEYRLEHLDPGRRNLSGREKFNANFALWAIEASTGDRTDGVYSRPNRGLLGLIGQGAPAAPAASEGTASVPVAASNQAGEVASAPPDASVQPDALQQLKFWWQQASKEQRGEFLIWSTQAN